MSEDIELKESLLADRGKSLDDRGKSRKIKITCKEGDETPKVENVPTFGAPKGENVPTFGGVHMFVSEHNEESPTSTRNEDEAPLIDRSPTPPELSGNNPPAAYTDHPAITNIEDESKDEGPKKRHPLHIITKEDSQSTLQSAGKKELTPKKKRLMSESEEKLYDEKQKFVQRRKIKLNVRGMAFETYETTLNRFPHTLLGTEEKRQQFFNPDTGYYDIQSSFYGFDAILFYYQSNGIVSCPAGYNQVAFMQEMDYFGIVMPEKPDTKMLLRKPESEATNLREEVLYTLEYPSYSKFSKIYAKISFCVILFASGLVCAESLVDPRGKMTIEAGSNIYNFWTFWDVLMSSIFFIEYWIRVVISSKRYEYASGLFGVFDLLAWLPSIIFDIVKHTPGLPIIVFDTCGFLRSLKILKVVRYSHGTQYLIWTVKISFGYVINFCFIVCCVGLFMSCCIFSAEQMGGELAEFKSAPDTFWFIIITMTTVGYGDLLVYTALGKVFVFITLLSGIIIMICLPVPMIFWRFCDIYEEEDEEKKWKKKMKQLKKLTLKEEDEMRLLQLEQTKEAPCMSFQGSTTNINDATRQRKLSTIEGLMLSATAAATGGLTPRPSIVPGTAAEDTAV